MFSSKGSEQAIKRAGVTVDPYEHIKFTIDDCTLVVPKYVQCLCILAFYTYLL